MQKQARVEIFVKTFLILIALLCFATTVSATWIHEYVDDPVNFTENSNRAIVLDSNGYPHIAYGGGNLYYTFFDGTDWQYQIVDSDPGVGKYASIGLDASGNVHISYIDGLNGALKYATVLSTIVTGTPMSPTNEVTANLSVGGINVVAYKYKLNNGAVTTQDTNVSLAVISSDAQWMSFSNDNVNFSGWEPYSSVRSWVLSTGDGNKTVYAHLKDLAGNVGTTSASIVLDNTAPSGNVAINLWAAYSTEKTVTLSISSNDAVFYEY